MADERAKHLNACILYIYNLHKTFGHCKTRPDTRPISGRLRVSRGSDVTSLPLPTCKGKGNNVGGHKIEKYGEKQVLLKVEKNEVKRT